MFPPAFDYKQVDGLVLYTDGSAMPNTGHYGSGSHGYAYRNLKDGEKPSQVNSMVLTDQGYKLKGEFGTEDTGVFLLGYYDVIQSNFLPGISNTAEVEAVAIALTSCGDFRDQLKKVHVISDSRYMVDVLNRDLKMWHDADWQDVRGRPIPEMAIWRSVWESIQALPSGCVLTSRWIKGHNDDLGNTRADYLAGIAMHRSMTGSTGVMVRKEAPATYLKTKCDMHPLLSMRRIYFNTNELNNERGLYYQVGASGQNFILGKRTSEASYSVVRLNTPDPVIECVQREHYRLRGSVDSLVYLRTDRIKSADVFPWISEYGDGCLIRDSRTEGLRFLDRAPLTVEVSPGELPLQAMDALSHLDQILTSYISKDPQIQFETFDITSRFYQDVQKQVRKETVTSKELLKDIKMGIVDIDVDVEHSTGTVKAKLMFSDDIPERNVLKRLEGLNPSISLILWKESDKVLRYATIVRVNDSVSIWSNYFASRIFIKPSI